MDDANLENNISDVDYENLTRQTPPGIPEHVLRVRIGAIMMLIINLSVRIITFKNVILILKVQNGLCNGTRVQIVGLGQNLIRCRILSGSGKGVEHDLFRTRFQYGADPKAPQEGMVRCERVQFPLRPGAVMTINKSQG